MAKAKNQQEAKQKAKELTFAEITADYKVLSEVEKDGYLVSELVTHSGYHVTTRIPIRTPEEEKAECARLARVLTQFAHPEWDLSRCEKITVIVDTDK